MCCFVLALLAEADFVDERVAVVHNRHTVVPVPHIELDTPARTTVRRKLRSGLSAVSVWHSINRTASCAAIGLRRRRAALHGCAALPTAAALQVTARLAMRCDAML
jgi:hypothetical protein